MKHDSESGVARFRRLMDLVGDALELPEADRTPWLEEQCGGEADLLGEARALLSERVEDSVGLTRDAQVGVDRAAAWMWSRTGAPPERIGPYEVCEVLGEGGMGVVFGARQLEPLRRDVAIKLLRPGMQAPRIVARFEAERHTLASLQHPYIAHVFDAGETAEGLPYFAMEWVRGLSITDFCDARRLGVTDRLSLFAKVLEAVQHAHEKGIIHRDLKPSNVLVTELGGKATPKVIDFGIARVEAGLEGRSTAHTAFGAVLGTIEYMSPEQALSPSGGVGTRADIYSLGVMLYELLTGVLPFPTGALREATPGQLERLLRDVEPPPPSRRAAPPTVEAAERARARSTDPPRLDRTLRGDLDNVIARAMHKDPDRRYASVAHFADDIGRYLAGRPVSARRATWRYKTRRFVGRHRWGVVGAAAAASVIVAMGVSFTYRLAVERDRARLEAEKSDQVARFLQELFRVPDPSAGPATDVTARELLDNGAARISAELVAQPELRASLLSVIAGTYGRLGLWPEAEERLEEALALARATYGDRHPEVAAILHDLASSRLGDLELAEEEFRAALALRREVIGPADTATASTMASLSLVLRSRGRLEEAEHLAREALGIQRAALGPDHAAIASSLHNLAFALDTQGRLDEAETVGREALAMRRRLFDPSHPDLLGTMSNLAYVLEAKGAYAEAVELFREAFERAGERLGDDHADTIAFMSNLAWCLGRMGEYDAALALLERAATLARVSLAGHHTRLANVLTNLGVALERTGALGRAEELHGEVLELNRANLGADHVRVADDLDRLGSLGLARGDLAAADSLHRAALDIRARARGEGDPSVATSLAGLGAVAVARGDAAGAEHHLGRALALRAGLREGDPLRAQSLHDLGAGLAKLGRPEEAEPFLRQALEARRASLGPEHPDVAVTLGELGAALAALGREPEARRVLGEAHDIAARTLRDSAPARRRIDVLLAELVSR